MGKILDAFQADALKTAADLKEVAASLRAKGMLGAEAICLRGAALAREHALTCGAEAGSSEVEVHE